MCKVLKREERKESLRGQGTLEAQGGWMQRVEQPVAPSPLHLVSPWLLCHNKLYGHRLLSLLMLSALLAFTHPCRCAARSCERATHQSRAGAT